MPIKITGKISGEQRKKDLEKYRQRALELGATDAKIIKTDMVRIDERVRAKCLQPKCNCYGTNINCPPYAMDLELMRKIAGNFRYAIFLMLKVPPEDIAGPDFYQEKRYHRHLIKGYEIICKLEAEAFYDGYYLATAFSSGPCKVAFCHDTECSALVPGQACRHALRARSSMEAVGMDAYTMASRVGWDIYPVGGSTDPASLPHGTILEIVFIC